MADAKQNKKSKFDKASRRDSIKAMVGSQKPNQLSKTTVRKLQKLKFNFELVIEKL